MYDFLTLCLSPVLQKTMLFGHWQKDQVNRALTARTDASGKGLNVCRTLTQMNESACHLTQLGGRHKDFFADLCQQEKLPLFYVDSHSEIRTCTTLLDLKDKTVSEMVEETPRVARESETLLLRLYQELLPQTGKTIILSGSRAAGYSEELMPRLVYQAHQAGKAVVLDIRGDDLPKAMEFSPWIIKPNWQEWCHTFSLPENDLPAVQAHATKILKEKNLHTLVLTRGTKALFYARNTTTGSPESGWLNIQALPALNSTGCGDSFTAALAALMTRKLSLVSALKGAAAIAAQSAQTLRPGDITPGDPLN